MSGWLTPTKITAWLECRHTMTLRRRVESGEMERPPVIEGSMGRLLQEKGEDHEHAVLERYRAAGRRVFDAGTLKPASGDFDEWVAACDGVLDGDHDVVFQMPFVHDGMRGVADFLVRPDGGGPGWEPVDAKLARTGAKVGHVLQLCFYADAIEAATGHAPEYLHVELGSGRVETVRRAEVHAYWSRLKQRLARSLHDEVSTRPEPCSYCGFCEYAAVCDDEWRGADSLVFVANLTSKDRHELEVVGIETMEALASSLGPIAELDDEKLTAHRAQARLQVASRQQAEGTPPAFEMIDVTAAAQAADDAQAAPRGWAMLPPPDDGDVFLDFEGHPFWRADSELFFLFGLIERDERPQAERHPSGWRFREWWAHSKEQEAEAVADLLRYLAARRAAHPDMHVYHYNHTERSALERLTAEHRTSEVALDQLVRSGVFVDLYRVVLGAVRVGAESYSLKEVEKLTGYERVAGIEQGAGAVADYDAWMTDGDQERLDRIAAYNDDDVRATRAVRDWLLAHEPDDAPQWQPPPTDEGDEELDARIAALQAFEAGSVEHLLGDLLGYWRREKRVASMQTFLLATAPAATRRESAGAIDAPEVLATTDRIGKRGTPLAGAEYTLTYPPQPVPAELGGKKQLVQVIDERNWAFYDVVDHDRAARRIVVSINKDGFGPPSGALVEYDNVRVTPKDDAVHLVADQFIARTPPPLVQRLLRNDAPAFVDGAGPAGGVFSSDLDHIRSWVTEIDGQVVPIQGPPGTGKTYNGARLIAHLVGAGKRVGIVAQSHAAIDNLVDAIVGHHRSNGTLHRLRLGRRNENGEGAHDSVTYSKNNDQIARGDFDIVAGTSWFFANRAMRDHPVDVLVVDEAGQLGLIDLIACSVSARSMLLLGDPQQLPQVCQATHPNGSGASCLGHLLGAHPIVTETRGVLLETTWRMHPDVCGYISDTFYDGSLRTHASCDVQTTSAGTGLRWIEVESVGCSTESLAEAEAIRDEIARLLRGGTWTRRERPADHSSALVTTPLTPADVLVVAPYNDQRRLLRRVFDEAGFGGVEVGTVDKFQGQEAPIVFFSMTSSSQADMPRGLDFLFSRNRLNVAISRARCLAHLVCTSELLDADAADVDDMRMIGAVTALAARST